jgi:hypothetical protein
MNYTEDMLAELHELRPEIGYNMDEYFRTQEYFATKRRKRIMTAITITEMEIEDDRCITESKDVV